MFLADNAKSDTPVDANLFGGPQAILNPEKYNDYLRLFQLN